MTFIPGTTDRVDHSFSVLDATYTNNKTNRQKLINKLMAVVDKTDIDPKCDKARDIETKLQVFNTVSSILNDDDKQANNYVKSNLSKKSEDQSAESNKQVIALLRDLKTSDSGNEGTLPMSSCDAEIDQLYDETGESIPDTELREDSGDFS